VCAHAAAAASSEVLLWNLRAARHRTASFGQPVLAFNDLVLKFPKSPTIAGQDAFGSFTRGRRVLKRTLSSGPELLTEASFRTWDRL
jgi:hypothetical protein